MQIPMQDGLMFATILFALGLAGLLVRRNILFMLMSLEVMMNAAGLAFVMAGARWKEADGQILFFFILTLAAAEISIGLALILTMYRRQHSLDADALSAMRG